VRLKNVRHWWATSTSKCLYKGRVTSMGVPLGYPLLWTGERLQKHIYHARDDANQPAGSGLGLGLNDVYKALRVTNKIVTIRPDPKRVSRSLSPSRLNPQYAFTWGLSRVNPQVTRFLLWTLPVKGELPPLILYTEIHSWCFLCFSSLLPSTCVNESFFCFYSFLSLSVSNRYCAVCNSNSDLSCFILETAWLLVYLAQTWVVPRNVLKRATWSWLNPVIPLVVISDF